MGAPLGNKFAIGNNGGRPPIYATPEELQAEVDGYFKYIEGEQGERTVINENGIEVKETYWVRYPEPRTVTGLTLYLGFSDRCSLDDYEKKDEFSHIIKRARKMVEYGYELNLHADKPTGSIFALKNMGWKDKTETEHSGNMSINWNETKTYESKEGL